MLNYLVVMLGGALGTGTRFWVSGVTARHFGEAFPLGTLIVNVTCSFIIGFFAEVTGPDGMLLVRPIIRQFFMIGVCGGYTTFSSFSLQTLSLARDGEWLDSEEKINGFLPVLDTMLDGGLVTLERVRVIFYRPGERRGQ